MSTTDGIRVEVDGRVATVTIDRPPANAINSAMASRLDRVWDELLAQDVLCLVLHSAHERFFMAGGDIFDYAQLDGTQMNALATKYRLLFRRLVELPVVSICAVDGLAVGGGAELALSCDLRVFGPNADFNLAEVKLGGLPAAGGTQALVKLLGYATALELMTTGRSMGQREAAETRLAIASNDPLRKARELADTIASMPADAVRGIKRTTLAGAEAGTAAGLAEEAATAEVLVGTDEFRDRVAAFVARSAARSAGS